MWVLKTGIPWILACLGAIAFTAMLRDNVPTGFGAIEAANLWAVKAFAALPIFTASLARTIEETVGPLAGAMVLLEAVVIVRLLMLGAGRTFRSY